VLRAAGPFHLAPGRPRGGTRRLVRHPQSGSDGPPPPGGEDRGPAGSPHPL